MAPQKLAGVLFGLGLTALSGALLMVAVTRGTPEEEALVPDPHMDLLSIPAFTLTNQDGETIARDALVGKLTIIDFMFTHCPFICPTMGQNMVQAQEFLDGSGVRFMSFSVDPEHDTPQRLKEYADSIGADTSTWTFLTGDMAQVQNILSEGLLLGKASPDPSQSIPLPDGSTMENIGHPGRFILVGPDVEIIALCDGTKAEDADALARRAALAAAELAKRNN